MVRRVIGNEAAYAPLAMAAGAFEKAETDLKQEVVSEVLWGTLRLAEPACFYSFVFFVAGWGRSLRLEASSRKFLDYTHGK